MKTRAFNALVMSLPSQDKAVRMRIWRALRDLGCGILRDGLYLLPAGAAQASGLTTLERQVTAAGGLAMTVELNLKTAGQVDSVRALFDRTGEYAALVAKLDAARKSLGRPGQPRAGTLIKRLRRAFARIVQIDFYPGQARKQAQAALTRLESAAQAHYSPHEPRRANRPVRRVDKSGYQGRIWASRKNPWIDRLASAWLIRRFVDRKARFKWLDDPAQQPGGSVGFDFDGAEFTHAGNKVTFEVLLASFALEGDPALQRLGATVHYLDVGGIPVDDARGLEMVLKGAREAARSDDDLVRAAAKVLDHVYSAYRSGAQAP